MSRDEFPLQTLAELATPQELRSLYLSIAKRVHPDREGGDAGKMREVNAAWDAIQEQGAAPSARWLATEARVAAKVAVLRREANEMYADIADKWNQRLAAADIQAQVTPASAGLFVLTAYDLREDEIATMLDAKLRENTPL